MARWFELWRARGRLLAFCLVLGVFLALAACGAASPTPTLTPSPEAITALPTATDTPQPAASVVGPPTLPATWTPTDTFTPVTPTATRTPTATPTITPTADAAARCAALQWIGSPHDGARLNFRDTRQVTFSWNYPLIDGGVALTIRRAGQDTALQAILGGPYTVIFSLPLSALYGPGVYFWEAVPVDADGEPIPDCGVSGRFTLLIRSREANPYPLPRIYVSPDLVPRPLIPRWWL